MNKHRLVTALAAGLMASVAQFANAADLDLRYHPKAEKSFTWTTCYVGVHLGIGAMKDTYTDQLENLWGFGVLGGGQSGCNYQIGRFVIGLESEGWFSSLKTHDNFATFGDAGRFSTANPWSFATSARAGIAVDDSFIYLKGGVAWGSFHYQGQQFGFGQNGTAINTGVLLGMGFEQRLSSQWSAKVEIDSVMFTATDANIASTEGADRFTISSTQVLFKVGANYLFDLFD
jgi:outer membrane immunogenic protein